MSPKNTIETTGDTVEDAISKGLAELGVGPTDVIVEVLEEPSRGVFGIGARPAKVRLQVIGGRRPMPATETPPAKPTSPASSSQKNSTQKSTSSKPLRQAASASEESYLEGAEEDDPLIVGEDELGEEVLDPDEDAVVGKEILNQLLTYMSVSASITIRRAAPTREGENGLWLLDVGGKDVSALIGRRGETLAALQYITRLISSRRLQRRANLIVDVDGYKSKRSRMLRQLAQRMADQAVKQKRTVTLEPMPPNERRIIHLTLRDHPEVSTRSVGEGDARKVTIVPK